MSTSYKSLFNETTGDADLMTIVDLTVTDTLDVTGAEIIGIDEIKINKIKVGNGSAAAPSYTFQNDTKTGIYLEALGEMAITVNGTKKIEFQDGFTQSYTTFISDDITNNNLFINNGVSFFYDTITVVPFSTGIVHSSSIGELSSSLIIDGDITPSTISASKLAGSIPDSLLLTISTAGKVSNIATTATDTNTPSAIVSRDINGSFSAFKGNFYQLNISALSANSILGVDSKNDVYATTLTDGQLLVGATGNVATQTTLTGTLNQVVVTNGAGSITLSLPQNINTSATPTFSGLTLSGLTAKGLLGLSALNVVTSTVLTNGQLLVGSTSNVAVAATITGTTNQITVTNGAGSITLATPQNIHTAATPTFASMTLTSVSNQLVLGTTNTVTISSTAPVSSRTYTIPDTAGNSNFVMTDLAQTINGNKTLSGTTNLSGLTAKTLLGLDASKNITSTALTNGQILVGSTSNVPVAATITGTTSQITVTNGAGTITLATPQNIATSSTPTFASMTLTSVSNQLVLGTTNTVTISSTAPVSSRTYTIPDTAANSNFVMTDLAQTINGNKTISGTTNLSGLTAKTLLGLDASKNITSTALTNGQLLIGSTSNVPVAATLTGTTNQVTVTNGAGTITLALPQSIATSSTPTFAQVTTASINDLTANSSINLGASNINLNTTGVTGNMRIEIEAKTSNSFIVTNAGVQTMTVTPSGLTVINGTVSAPSYSFIGDTNTGIYRIGADNIGLACNGTKILDVSTASLAVTGALSASGAIQASDGSVTTPGYTFSNSSTMGMYLLGANNLGISVGSTKMFDILSTGTTLAGTLAMSALFSNSGQPCHIRTRNATQSVSNTTDTTLTNWGTVELNQGSITYATGVFTVPSAGVYLMWYEIDWADNTTGTRNSNFYINNSSSARRARINIGAAASGGQGIFLSASDVCSLSASDTVRIVVWQNSGGALNSLTDASDRVGILRLF